MYLRDNLEVVLEDRATARKVEPAPFSLESLIAWLDKQPASVEYTYTSPKNCLLGQYTLANGGYIGDDNYYHIADHAISLLPHGMGLREEMPKALDTVVYRRPHTMGAALTRAQAALERLLS